MGQASFSTCQRLDPCLLYGLPLRPKKYDLDHWKLRSLELRGCTFVLDSPAFGNLVELSLHNLPCTVAYSPHDLARSVATMSRLKRLKIVNATLTNQFWRARTRGLTTIRPPSTSRASNSSQSEVPLRIVPSCFVGSTSNWLAA